MVPGYIVRDLVLSPRWLGEVQQRRRRFSFGTKTGAELDVSQDLVLWECAAWERAVLASEWRAGENPKPTPVGATYHNPNKHPRRSLTRVLELQGFPPDFLDESPLTVAGKYRLIGNAVPVQVSRVLARAVRRALGTAGQEGAA